MHSHVSADRRKKTESENPAIEQHGMGCNYDDIFIQLSAFSQKHRLTQGLPDPLQKNTPQTEGSDVATG